MMTKLAEFCYSCGCFDYNKDYYLHVEDEIAYCRSAMYDNMALQEGDNISYKHSCQFLAEDTSLKVLMLKRKFDLIDCVVFKRELSEFAWLMKKKSKTKKLLKESSKCSKINT